MRLNKQEKIVEQIALLLLKFEDEDVIGSICSSAKDIAVRALRARSDPSWWEVVGKPYFTLQLRRIKAALRR